MKTGTKVVIGLGLVIAVALGIYGATRGNAGGHFVIGDYIQLKDGTGPVWKITQVKPDMVTVSGNTTYVGVYYTAQMPLTSNTTALWSFAYTEANYRIYPAV